MDTILLAQYNNFGRKCRREDTDRLLLKTVDAFLKMNAMPGGKLEIERTKAGKPYVSGEIMVGEKLPFVSVSHTGNQWFGAASWYPVGIDVEQVKSLDFAKLAGRFYSASEKEYCDKAGLSGFFRIWCRKEALVKIKGSTLGKGLSGFETAPRGVSIEKIEIEGTTIYLQDYCPREGLAGCIASEKKSRLHHVEIK